MAAPTPTIRTISKGRGWITTWHAVWATGDQLTDSVAIDISALQITRRKIPNTFLEPTRLKISKISGAISGNIQVILEWDATTDALLWRFDNNADTTEVYNFEFDPPIYDPQATGYTGDVLLTTLGAAAGDEVQLTFEYAPMV